MTIYIRIHSNVFNLFKMLRGICATVVWRKGGARFYLRGPSSTHIRQKVDIMFEVLFGRLASKHSVSNSSDCVYGSKELYLVCLARGSIEALVDYWMY